MERNRRYATWSGAILGLFLALVMNAALARASDYDDAVVTEEFHQTYPLASGGRIDLENINGSVHITAWDQNQVKVDAIKRAGTEELLKNAEIRVNARADSISIETHYLRQEGWHDEHHNPPSVEYTLMVPRNARLDEIKLINGSLDVTGVAGEVRASCINGKLLAQGLGGRAKLSTINGHLDANFERLQATPIELSSVNGPLEVTLPSDAKASIEATTVHGGIDNDFGLHTNNHRWVGHDLRGELGGGGVQVRLNNVNGRIEVHHANDGHAVSPAKDVGGHDGDDEI